MVEAFERKRNGGGGGCKQVGIVTKEEPNDEPCSSCGFYCEVFPQVVVGVLELHSVRPLTTSAPSWSRSRC